MSMPDPAPKPDVSGLVAAEPVAAGRVPADPATAVVMPSPCHAFAFGSLDGHLVGLERSCSRQPAPLEEGHHQPGRDRDRDASHHDDGDPPDERWTLPTPGAGKVGTQIREALPDGRDRFTGVGQDRSKVGHRLANVRHRRTPIAHLGDLAQIGDRHAHVRKRVTESWHRRAHVR